MIVSETKRKSWTEYALATLAVAIVLISVSIYSANSVFKIPTPSTAQGIDPTLATIKVDALSNKAASSRYLYIVDENGNALLNDVRVRKGSVFTIKWDTTSWSSGKSHLLLLDSNQHEIMDKRVSEKSGQKISSDYPFLIKFYEEYRGQNRLIRDVPVQVF